MNINTDFVNYNYKGIPIVSLVLMGATSLALILITVTNFPDYDYNNLAVDTIEPIQNNYPEPQEEEASQEELPREELPREEEQEMEYRPGMGGKRNKKNKTFRKTKKNKTSRKNKKNNPKKK